MTTSLRERLARDDILVLPGAANALAALMIEDAGFEAVYLSGAGIANSFLGVPDIGLLTLTELAAHVSAVRDAVAIPIVVDCDTGFGNAVGVGHTVRRIERAGANAIQIEDQTFPKRCGHFSGKSVITLEEMVQKVHAAVDARRSEETLIIARTDARATHGLQEALERANAYREAGADVIFVEAPNSIAELEETASAVPGPKLVNFVQGGATPEISTGRAEELGFSVALFANLALLGAIAGMRGVLTELRAGRGSAGLSDQQDAWAERQRLVRTAEFSDRETRYA